ncbi:hypothetical protein [Nesterenkonia ebinurensis]|uniref:hypothetical protein n=1 Tax=Nesterenkonia ebinurensis TaxID=2608252 RepID=UPI00123DECCA|nr:hypothetical protein [Nesterenkonia ebinurensis]
MTELPEQITSDAAQRTTWMRRYTLDPALAEKFVQFLTTKVIPAREDRGFTVESIWLDNDLSELTWFVSRLGDSEEFAAAERDWEESQERAEIFAGTPTYVTAKDLRDVTRLR